MLSACITFSADQHGKYLLLHKHYIGAHLHVTCLFESYSEQVQQVLSLETELEGYKRSIQKEQEHNEKLTLILAKAERDIDSVKKQLTQCHTRFDALKAEYTTYTRMLHETEQALNRAAAVSCSLTVWLGCLFGLGETPSF